MTTPPLENAPHDEAEAEWRRRVEVALKGHPAESLRGESYEGIPIEPLYRRLLDDRPRALRQKPGRWRVFQRMDQPGPVAANETAHSDLQNGAGGLVLVAQGAAAARGFGMAIATLADLEQALAGIELDLIGLRLDAGIRALELGGLLGELAHKRRLTAAKLAVDVGHDPIGLFALTGRLGDEPAALGREAAAAVAQFRGQGFDGHLFLADGRPYHEAGAGESQELAAVLATALAYQRLLADVGTPLDAARENIAVLLVADADEFFTLAKFRAMRRLWARVEEACGLTPKPLALHAETAWRMMTRHDPAVNILRTTAAAFSAGLGGADAITVLPHTLPLGLPDGGARRLARNGQLILMDEAHLDAVSDPAAGAGGFEALTDSLCVKAWALFQAIEAKGGMIAALEAGLPQAAIAATLAARMTAVATLRAPLTGTSAFPNFAELPAEVLMAPPPMDIIAAPARAVASCTPLVGARDAAPFEAIRARAEAGLAAGGQRLTVFLANLGAPADVAVRAGFAVRVFAAGGIESMPSAELASPQDVADAFRAGKSRIACVCAPDATDADSLKATIAALRDVGATGIYYAGHPGVRENALRAIGFDGFIFLGCNTLALLEDVVAAALML